MCCEKTPKNPKNPVCNLYSCLTFCAKAGEIFLPLLLTVTGEVRPPVLPNPKLSKPLLDIFTVV